MIRRIRCAVLVALCLTVHEGPAQSRSGGGEANPSLMTHTAALQEWQAMRFGMFVHWGPVTLRGTEIGWSRGTQVRIDDYDGLHREFDPVLFNAREWVGAAKAAGMRYFIITTKHHDGFCLWPAAGTEYDIMATPFRRDVLQELADECRRQGVLFGTYYSILDWHHPDYPVRYGGDPRPVEGSDMNRYRSYLKGQVRELITRYDTNILWFDGQWEDPWTHADGMDLYAYARDLKDRILINNRVDKGHGSGEKGMSASARYAGDFGTPEQEVGAFDNLRPWESCITIGTQWSWKPNDRMKSAAECIRTLASTAGRGGNLLLNISPMPDGRIERRQLDRLEEIGRWLHRFGESIYATRGGPLKPESWLASTHRDNRIYVHLLKQPNEELVLPRIPGRAVVSAAVLQGPRLSTRTSADHITITLPREPIDPAVGVIVLQLDGPADGTGLMDVPENRFDESHVHTVTLRNPPAPAYAAGGSASLVDGIRGTAELYDGEWLGFEQTDCEAVLELPSTRQISSVTVGCLQAQGSWIFLPTGVEVSVSENGSDFRVAGTVESGPVEQSGSVGPRDLTVAFDAVMARFVKVRAFNIGVCPPWHKGAGGKAWVFVDEIVVR